MSYFLGIRLNLRLLQEVLNKAIEKYGVKRVRVMADRGFVFRE